MYHCLCCPDTDMGADTIHIGHTDVPFLKNTDTGIRLLYFNTNNYIWITKVTASSISSTNGTLEGSNLSNLIQRLTKRSQIRNIYSLQGNNSDSFSFSLCNFILKLLKNWCCHICVHFDSNIRYSKQMCFESTKKHEIQMQILSLGIPWLDPWNCSACLFQQPPLEYDSTMDSRLGCFLPPPKTM